MEYLAIIIAILLVVVSFPTIKGFLGETAVRVYLSRLDKEKYKILNDVMIQNSKGKTSQIDHVIISIYGIFVIETKNYKGWIFGSEDSYQWKQVIYKRKEKLYNPIKQNWGHVMALKEILKDYLNALYHPIVTFSTRATLKLNNVSSDVVYNPKLVRTIRKYDTECLSIEEVEQIYNTLITMNITDKNAKKQHIQDIKATGRKIQENIADNTCPRCGGTLVKRKGKYGSFKGCSNYPKCRYTVN